MEKRKLSGRLSLATLERAGNQQLIKYKRSKKYINVSK